LSISDLKMNEQGDLEPIVLFGSTIGDQASMDKIISLADSIGKMTMDSTLQITKGFKHIAISNNKQAADQFAAGTVKQNFDFYNKLSESAVTGIIDFQNIFGKLKMLPMAKDTMASSLLMASEKTFENIIFTGGVFNDGGLIQNMELNFVNKDSNSLKQMNRYFEEVQRIMEIKKNISDTTASVIAH